MRNLFNQGRRNLENINITFILLIPFVITEKQAEEFYKKSDLD